MPQPPRLRRAQHPEPHPEPQRLALRRQPGHPGRRKNDAAADPGRRRSSTWAASRCCRPTTTSTHVLDYRKVRRIIIDECTEVHMNLLESLIGKLAHRLMQLPGVLGVRVKIAKLKIFDDCEVAIRVRRGSGRMRRCSGAKTKKPCRRTSTRRSSARRTARKSAWPARRARLCREVGARRRLQHDRRGRQGQLVCVSGGKDSYALLDILLKLRPRADPLRHRGGQPRPDSAGFPEDVLPTYLTALGVPFHIEDQDTYSIVKRVIPEGKTTCGLRSRLRRGILYRVADELGATKVALGHHRDDMLQTFFLNMFFAAKLKSMPPKLVSDDGQPRRDPPAGLRGREGPDPLGPAPRIPDHSVHAVRQPGKPAAQAGRQHAARVGEEAPRPPREHVRRPAEHRAVAPAGRNILRLQGSEGHGCARPRRRQGLRRTRIPCGGLALAHRPAL